MAKLLEGKPVETLNKPDNVIGATVCATSGLLPQPAGSPYVCPTRFEYFIKGTLPRTVDPGMRKVFVDKTTQTLAPAGKTDNVEEKDEAIVTDPTGDSYCVTCPQPQEPTPTPH
jgi:hypothetical protein